MKAKLVSLAVVLLLLMLSASAVPVSPTFADQKMVVTSVIWGSGATSLNARPGDVNVPLGVVVQNLQSVSLSAVLYTLYLSYPFTNSTGGDTALASVPTQPSGASASLQFLLSIDGGASSGLYQLNMTVSYFGGSFTRQTLNLTVPVYVSDPVMLDLLDAQWGSPGSVSSVAPSFGSSFYYVMLRDPLSSPLTAVQGAISLPQGFTSSTGGSVALASVAALQPGVPTPLQFTIVVGDTLPGSYSANLSVSFYDATNSLLTYRTTVPLVVSSSAASFSVLSTTWTSGVLAVDARPGSSSLAFNVQFQSLLNSTATGLTLSLALVDPFFGPNGASYAYASYPALSPGATATASFTMSVSPSASPGVYSIPLTISYVKPTMERASTTVYVLASVKPIVQLEMLDSGFGSPGNAVGVQPYEGASTFYLLVRNPTSTSLSGLVATVALPDGITGPSGSPWASTTLPVLQAGQSAVLQFAVDVGPASVGLLPATVRFSFLDVSNSPLSSSAAVLIRVIGKVSLSLSLSGSATVGANSSVMLKVSNSGAVDISGVDVTLTPTTLVLLDRAKFHIDSLPVGASASVPLSLYASALTSPGLYPLAAALQYKDASGATNVETRTLGVNVLPYGSPVTVGIDDFRVYTARSNYRSIAISSDGADLSDVQVSASVQAPGNGLSLVGGAGPWFIGDLRAGSTYNLALTLQPSANFVDQLATLTLTVSYVGPDGAAHSESRQVNLLVKGIPEMGIQSIKTAPTPAINGTRVTLTCTLLNTGTSTSYYTNIVVTSSDPALAGLSYTRYVGDLSVDTPTPFSIPIDLPSTLAAGTYSFNMTVHYQDSYGTPSSVTLPVQIQVVQGQAPPASSATVARGGLFESAGWILLAVLAIAVVLYFVLRSRRRPRVE